MPNTRETLIESLCDCVSKSITPTQTGTDRLTIEIHHGDIADHLIANGVTVQKCCHKAESVISKTGLMCTACHSDIDRDADFCKYCGAMVMPQPPKGE